MRRKVKLIILYKITFSERKETERASEGARETETDRQTDRQTEKETERKPNNCLLYLNYTVH